MKNDKTSYVVLEHELNLMSELGTDEESGERRVLFLLHDNSFYAFNETACNMWKIISTNSDYKNAKQQIFGLYPQIKTEELSADIEALFEYLIEIGAIILTNCR